MADPSPSPSAVHLPVLTQRANPSTTHSASPALPPLRDPARHDSGPMPAAPPSIRYSHLARFAQCPLSFRLHYVDRLTPDIAAERRARARRCGGAPTLDRMQGASARQRTRGAAAGRARAHRRAMGVAVHKDDRKPPRATMSLEDFVALLNDWHDLLLQRR